MQCNLLKSSSLPVLYWLLSQCLHFLAVNEQLLLQQQSPCQSQKTSGTTAGQNWLNVDMNMNKTKGSDLIGLEWGLDMEFLRKTTSLGKTKICFYFLPPYWHPLPLVTLLPTWLTCVHFLGDSSLTFLLIDPWKIFIHKCWNIFFHYTQ